VDVFELSDRLVDEVATLSPIAATYMGIPGYDHLWQDFSPAGVAAAAEVFTDYRSRARRLPEPQDDWERLALRVVLDYLDDSLSQIEHQDHLRDLNNTASPLQSIVQVFDMMDTSTAEGCGNVSARLNAMKEVLGGYQAALEAGLERGLLAARRQVLAAVDECRSYAGDGSFLVALSDRMHECSTAERDSSVEAARGAFTHLADFLENRYMPVAPEADGVGEDRYIRSARRFLGADIDPVTTYAWGWSEVVTIWDRMQRVAGQIAPDRTVAEVLELLKTDPERCLPDEASFLSFIGDRQRDAVERLAGIHFDIPDEMRSVDVKLAPAGSALGAYYHQPSEDFSRPGAVFYSMGDKRPISIYDEVSTGLPRGISRASSPGGYPGRSGGQTQPLPPDGRLVPRLRRRVGPLRRGIDGRTRILREA
jgi:uncharacterized protein (DUF885 family)